MDRKGFINKDIEYRKNEAYISPLHEALRGTTAIPILDELVGLNSSPPCSPPSMQNLPIVRALQEPAMMPIDDYSLMSQSMDLALPPRSPRLPHTVLTPSSLVSSTASLARLTASPRKQQPMLVSQRNFLTTPMRDYFNMSDQMQILSMESPSITSVLQGEPLAIVHAHLNITGVLDHGPIFENPTWHIPEVRKLTATVLPFPLENHHS